MKHFKGYVVVVVIILVSVGVLEIFFYRQNSFSNRFLDDFYSAPKNEKEAFFMSYIEKVNPEKIINILEGEFPLCHEQAHELGMAIFKKTGEIDQAIRLCGEGCTGGCFHGALIGAFGGNNTSPDDHVSLSELKNKAVEICGTETVSEFHRKGKCVHGIGHAFTYFENYNIPAALEDCALFGDERLEYYCAGGVFMEYEFVYGQSDMLTKSLNYPCDVYGKKFPAACYPHKTNHLVARIGREGMIRECLAFEDSLAKSGCFHGLGFSYNLEVERDPKRIGEICKDGTLSDREACLEGAIAKFSEINQEKAFEACRFLENDERKFCEEIVRLQPYSLDRSFDLYFNH